MLLLNQTWVHLPSNSKVHLLTRGCGEGNFCVYCRALYWLRRRQWHPTPVLLPGKSHGRRSLVGCSPWGHEESDTTERLHFHFSLSCIGEGNGNPLQCSCLENPRDGGAWWAAVYGVTQSRTWLKQLSSSSIPTQWTQVWVSPKRWWRTGKPGMLQSVGLQESDTAEWLNNNRALLCSLLKTPELLEGFQQSIFRGQAREKGRRVCDYLKHSSLIGWWWGHRAAGLFWWLSGKESSCNAGNMAAQVQSLHQQDPLEEEMAPHSSILAWEIPWTEEPGWLPFLESQRVRQDWTRMPVTEQYHRG